MNWQYQQLEIIARHRYETLMREAAQERLLAELRAGNASEKHTVLTTYARRTTRWLRLALRYQQSELRTQTLASDL
jgi:hypothetical protein